MPSGLSKHQVSLSNWWNESKIFGMIATQQLPVTEQDLARITKYIHGAMCTYRLCMAKAQFG